MQKTNFRFEAIVHDDASTDGTAAIVKEYAEKYPDIIKPIFETENLYSKRDGSLFLIMNRHIHGKYVALCEGDDYWIDPFKLQRQVDLLEKHKECSFVYSGFNVVDKNSVILHNHKFEKRMDDSHSGNVFFDLLVNQNFIMTLTVIMRREIFDSIESYYYDYGFFLCAARMGEAIYLPDRTANYRINPTSITNTNLQSLVKPMYAIILNEVKRSLYDSTTSKNISEHPLFKTVLGYIIARNIRKSTQKKDFLKLVLEDVRLYPYIIKGLWIYLLKDKNFRIKVKRMSNNSK